jgi:hypothetical protein
VEAKTGRAGQRKKSVEEVVGYAVSHRIPPPPGRRCARRLLLALGRVACGPPVGSSPSGPRRDRPACGGRPPCKTLHFRDNLSRVPIAVFRAGASKGADPTPFLQARTGPPVLCLLGVLMDHVAQQDVWRLRDLHRLSPPPLLCRPGADGQGEPMLKRV